MTKPRPKTRAVLRVAMLGAPSAFALTWALRATSAWWVESIGYTTLSVVAVVLEAAVSGVAGYAGAASLCVESGRRRAAVMSAATGGCLGWGVYPGVSLAADGSGALLVHALYTDVLLCVVSAAAGGLLASLAADRGGTRRTR
ncbi:hypothetical protein [Kitasatospora sp. NPDC059571]|uniref:hypothetical protein n=1 Tax=Kitasatospora sp. NPDC059571 TaxID=3346871 RepID=UPI0036D0C210